MRIRVAIVALACMAALPAVAEEKCTAPKDTWRPVEELTKTLTEKGWIISNVKQEDGCYEVYAKDDQGKRVEAFFDPASFEVVGYDD